MESQIIEKFQFCLEKSQKTYLERFHSCSENTFGKRFLELRLETLRNLISLRKIFWGLCVGVIQGDHFWNETVRKSYPDGCQKSVSTSTSRTRTLNRYKPVRKPGQKVRFCSTQLAKRKLYLLIIIFQNILKFV